MYCVLNTLSEYTYFYLGKNITSLLLLLAFKTVESLQCILNHGNKKSRDNIGKVKFQFFQIICV